MALKLINHQLKVIRPRDNWCKEGKKILSYSPNWGYMVARIIAQWT